MKRLFRLPRYFLVCYVTKDSVGHLNYQTTNGSYVNREKVQVYLYKEYGYSKSAITSIIEISKRDCLDFIKEKNHKSDNSEPQKESK